MHFLKHLATILIILTVFQLTQAQTNKQLWYDEPAQFFEETLVLGNGKMGASLFGGVSSEKIYLNDATLWSGEPVNPNMNPDAHKYVPLVRKALEEENYRAADSINKYIQGSFSQSFAPLGTMLINFIHEGEVKDYHRGLDISKALSKLEYTINETKYTREYFISHPDKVMVIKLQSSNKGALNFDIEFESLLKNQMETKGEILEIKGYAPYHAEPNYRGNMPNAVRFDESRGIHFANLIKIHNTDGEILKTDQSVGVRNASHALIIISIETSFNGFDKDPVKEGKNYYGLAKNNLEKLKDKSYQDIKQTHAIDYEEIFNRLNLDLGESTAPNLPTDERLKRYAKGEEDKNLEILYFQYGRYLLISSSRTAEVPANLQGIWNPYLRPPWSSNYTANINVEENYWLAETANLTEMHQPLLSFIGNLAKTGSVTAETFYGVNKGWASCHNTDIWAMSNPVGDFGKGHPVWANWNMSGAWLVTHLWDHFLFTQDYDYLSNYAYPLMKGAAEFCLEWMVEDANANLITSPSTSPENLYRLPDGYYGATLYGSTADIAMIRECLQQTLEATRTLNIDKNFAQEVSMALDKLLPYKIGKKGNLQEWYHDWEDADPKHRHQSHLFGLHPGNHISPATTPDIADACRKTLEIKGDETTGWSKGWRINLWAKLWDGNRAYKMYRELLKYVPPDGLRTDYGRGGGTYPNLFDAHPPFQIDGNFGGSAAVIEMLLQSSSKEIRILPALPDAWEKGEIKGARTRGGFEIDIAWNKHELSQINIRSTHGGKTRIIYKNQYKQLDLKPGEELILKKHDLKTL